MGEESDDEESQSLTRGKPEGDIGLVKQENSGSTEDLDEDDSEEDKREWSFNDNLIWLLKTLLLVQAHTALGLMPRN